MRAGITGHQNLENYDIEWINDAIQASINENNINYGITSLAKGADQYFAEILLKNNINYKVIIPSEKYETTFLDKQSVINYNKLLSLAKCNIKLDNKEPNELAFYQAGEMVIELSDILIAVWDGEKSKGLGGTADIVKLAIELHKRVIHINPVNKTKKNINND